MRYLTYKIVSSHIVAYWRWESLTLTAKMRSVLYMKDDQRLIG